MERIGERLRRRREELGFTIDDIARATKYRPDVIKAVEEGRAGVFPAEAYRQAFLRAYADKLGLDAAEVVREQKSEEERVREALKGIRFKARTNHRLRRTLIWLVVVVAVAAGLLVLYDRVIKVRVLGGPVEEGEGPAAAGAGSTDVGTPDSQVIRAPADSAVIDEGQENGGPGSMGADDNETGETGSEPGEDEDSRSTRSESDDVEPEMEAAAVVPIAVAEERAAADAGEAGGREGELEAALAPEGETGGPVDKDWLAVWVRGYSVKATLRTGDSILVDCRLEPGFSDTFYSFQPFWADTIIADGNAIVLVLNGEEIPLPDASGSVITDFRISP